MPKYDVSVLRLSSDVTLTEHIQPVCLPHSDGRDRGPLAITGWGNTWAGAGPPRPADILQLLYVNEVPLPFCNDDWKTKVDEDLSVEVISSSTESIEGPTVTYPPPTDPPLTLPPTTATTATTKPSSPSSSPTITYPSLPPLPTGTTEGNENR